mmetsp:Transcript_7384/g.13151  ORF Transcript_7384/g.13151 Transcript_7384/m.13151 type:complete len:99 (+) Transcript_7384:90-386(+)
MLRRTSFLLRKKASEVPREVPEGGLSDGAQWFLTVGVATVIPGFAIFKCFQATGAVEAERGVQQELERSRRLRAAEAAAKEAGGPEAALETVRGGKTV